jgi:hypothetical protein
MRLRAWSRARGEGFEAPLRDLRWPNPRSTNSLGHSVDEGSSQWRGLRSSCVDYEAAVRAATTNDDMD